MEAFDVPIGETFPVSKARLLLQRRKQSMRIVLIVAIELLWHTGDENLSGNQADEDHRKTFSCQNWDSFITVITGDLVFPS